MAMAQRNTERETVSTATERAEPGAMQRESAGAGAGAGAMQREGTGAGAMQRQGGITGGGPFSLIDWMLDRLQRDFFGGAAAGSSGAMQPLSGGGTRMPRLNVSETDNEVVISAEVPGVDPNDVQIEIEDDVLTLRAEAREERDEDDGTVVSYTRFFTQLPLPDEIDANTISASSRNGMVTIRLPKAQQSRNVRRIPVSGGDGGAGSGEASPATGQKEGQQRAA
jgi:HSP20 family protein